jgi:hypothetical protein
VTADVRRGRRVLGRPETFLLVGGADPELADPRMNEAVLRRLALATGGQFLEEDAIGALPDLLRRSATHTAKPEAVDAWHTGWSFLAVMLLLSAEWTLRRLWGLR